MNNIHTFIVESSDNRKRLDGFLVERLQKSRNSLQKFIIEGRVKVNGETARPNYKLKPDDEITVTISPVIQPSINPEEIPLDIIFEDEDIIVVNKPRGMVVYPTMSNPSGTLVNAVLNHTEQLSFKSGLMRPGIVHRLDKDTSGVMVMAKSDLAHTGITKQFKNRKITKIYRAIVGGQVLENEAVINAPIGRHPIKRKEMSVTSKNSKEAITRFKVLERFKDATLVEVNIATGRTHQIRVHMKFIGHPIIGDPTYSKRKTDFNIKGQALHACKLGFNHPRTNQYMLLTAPIPNDMALILNSLRKRNKEG